MKKITYIIIFALLAVCGCSNDKNKSAANINDINNPHGMKSPAGKTYLAILPENNTKGVENYVIFRADGSARLELRKIDSDTIPTYFDGKWSQSDTLISAVFNTVTYNFVIRQNDKIYYLQNYNTNKQKAYTFKAIKQFAKEQVEGVYAKYKANNVHSEVMTVKNVGGEEYEVKIESTGSSIGCVFLAKGNLINNRIYINLSDMDKDLKSKMTITFRDNQAYIFTEDAKDIKDLVNFCSNGRSLIGNYARK